MIIYKIFKIINYFLCIYLKCKINKLINIMIGEKIPNAIYIFLGIYVIILLIISFFIQRFFIRKGSNILLNIFSIFLWFTMLVMILIFPLDLFSNFIYEDNEDNTPNTKIFSEFLYWNFYICGFMIVDQIKSYMVDGNFTVTSKIISCVKGMAFFMIFFIGIGVVLDLIFQFFSWLLGENNFLTVAINIIKTVIGMPMLIAYLMFLGCALGDMPRDLYVKFNYPKRIKKLCWEITHTMKKYKKETEFLILSINKIKMAQDKINNLNMEELNKEINEAKQLIDQENDEEEKKNKKNKYESLRGIKELSNFQNEMNEVLTKLEKTVKTFNLNIPLESIDKEDEKRPLKNKKELIEIHATYKIYCTQIYRINYQKYSIYKEWAEIKSFLGQGLNQQSLEIESNKNDINIDIKEQNEVQLKEKQNFEFQKVVLTKKQIMYYKYMPIVSIILIIICLLYGILMIIGQLEYTFKWDMITGKFFRWLFTNYYIITPLRLFPMYFTLFAICYSFTSIKSDITSCVYGHRQTELCHALFFVGMIAKLICPLCFNFIEIMYNGIDLKGNNSKITLYFEEQFGFLNSDSIIILVSKLVLLALFLKAIIMNATGYYGTVAYKKNQYLSYNARYVEKELEIMEGEGILNDMNRKYGSNFEQLKADNIFE